MTSLVLVGHTLKHAEGDAECPICSEMEHPTRFNVFQKKQKPDLCKNVKLNAQQFHSIGKECPYG